MKHRQTLDLREIDQADVAIAGGKGANLGALSGIEGIQVPGGFCITTAAFRQMMDETPLIHALLDQLSALRVGDREQIGTLSAQLRGLIESAVLPDDLVEEIARHLARLGTDYAYAVRSSATAEDLPAASFAGQQDTYLNIIGQEAIQQHISKCWASLFTDRAVIYRLQNGVDHRAVHLAVIVQQMVFPQVAGILFTADPVTGNRKVSSIDAGFGLGEALVSGLVNADVFKVRNGAVIEKQIATKKRAIYALQAGGTQEQELAPEQQNLPALTDARALQLERLGRTIEAHFGHPQDIEWCLAGDVFYIVQSRPITTLYPIPEANDGENHVYVSVGHQQMMTDALKPLGVSFWQLAAVRPMPVAGGRMFVDVSNALASPAGRENLLGVLGQSDPLIRDALTTLIEREDFIRSLPYNENEQSPIKSGKGMSAADILAQAGDDPATVAGLIAWNQASIEALRQDIRTRSGTDLFDFITAHIREVKKQLFDSQNLNVIMAAINAAAWINEKMKAWLGEKNAADTLAQSVDNNITSEMGLALLDVADVIRPYPEVIRYLQQTKDDNFLEELVRFPGGVEARAAIGTYLDKYGMRCAGEIDITKPRWSEKPITLVPLILSNMKNQAPGESKRKFEQGRQEALKKEQDLLERLLLLPDGEQKAREARQMIGLLRNFAGYREYPKYSLVSRYFIYKQALLSEAEQLVKSHVIPDKETIYYLSFEELREVVRTHQLDPQLIDQRKEAYKRYEKLTPPRVLTSDGEIITGRYKHEDLPSGAIAGLAVSAGVIEGRARVILSMEAADLEERDILVTTFTDPSWTPLFVSIKGLVTEVGGLMTHGAVIAREYGLPAVVGVENATKLIRDGQCIRVNGTDGYVEIL